MSKHARSPTSSVIDAEVLIGARKQDCANAATTEGFQCHQLPIIRCHQHQRLSPELWRTEGGLLKCQFMSWCSRIGTSICCNLKQICAFGLGQISIFFLSTTSEKSVIIHFVCQYELLSESNLEDIGWMYLEAWHTQSPIEEFPLPLKLSGTCGPERIIKFWSHRGNKKGLEFRTTWSGSGPKCQKWAYVIMDTSNSIYFKTLSLVRFIVFTSKLLLRWMPLEWIRPSLL